MNVRFIPVEFMNLSIYRWRNLTFRQFFPHAFEQPLIRFFRDHLLYLTLYVADETDPVEEDIVNHPFPVGLVKLVINTHLAFFGVADFGFDSRPSAVHLLAG